MRFPQTIRYERLFDQSYDDIVHVYYHLWSLRLALLDVGRRTTSLVGVPVKGKVPQK